MTAPQTSPAALHGGGAPGTSAARAEPAPPVTHPPGGAGRERAPLPALRLAERLAVELVETLERGACGSACQQALSLRWMLAEAIDELAAQAVQARPPAASPHTRAMAVAYMHAGKAIDALHTLLWSVIDQAPPHPERWADIHRYALRSAECADEILSEVRP